MTRRGRTVASGLLGVFVIGFCFRIGAFDGWVSFLLPFVGLLGYFVLFCFAGKCERSNVAFFPGANLTTVGVCGFMYGFVVASLGQLRSVRAYAIRCDEYRPPATGVPGAVTFGDRFGLSLVTGWFRRFYLNDDHWVLDGADSSPSLVWDVWDLQRLVLRHRNLYVGWRRFDVARVVVDRVSLADGAHTFKLGNFFRRLARMMTYANDASSRTGAVLAALVDVWDFPFPLAAIVRSYYVGAQLAPFVEVDDRLEVVPVGFAAVDRLVEEGRVFYEEGLDVAAVA